MATRIGTYSQIKGSPVKLPCVAATTTNVNFSTAPSVVDGHTLSINDRVLAIAQTTASTNGIYIVNTTGITTTWSRALDLSEDDDVFAGIEIYVTSGLTYNGNLFILDTPNPIILNTTPLSFVVKTSNSTTSFYPWNNVIYYFDELLINNDNSILFTNFSGSKYYNTTIAYEVFKIGRPLRWYSLYTNNNVVHITPNTRTKNIQDWNYGVITNINYDIRPNEYLIKINGNKLIQDHDTYWIEYGDFNRLVVETFLYDHTPQYKFRYGKAHLVRVLAINNGNAMINIAKNGNYCLNTGLTLTTNNWVESSYDNNVNRIFEMDDTLQIRILSGTPSSLTVQCVWILE